MTSPAARAGAVAAALAATAALAAAPSALAPIAARAALAAAALFVAAALARRRSTPAAAPLGVVARAPVAHGASIAIVEADGRRFLVGAGKDGVRVLARLPGPRREGERP